MESVSHPARQFGAAGSYFTSSSTEDSKVTDFYAFVDCPICTSTIRELHVPAVRVGELTMDIL
jgi:hypothetical protein